jgi:hypothetical protein
MRVSSLPGKIGRCAADGPQIARAVNEAQLRLLFAKEAGEEGWYGTWAEMVFNVSRATPYITTPRGVARIEMMTVCNEPVAIQNQFYEYLEFGNGTLPKRCPDRWRSMLQTYSRNNVPTFTDLTSAPQLIRAYFSTLDVSRRVLVQGLDSNGNTIYSQNGFQRVSGEFMTFGLVPNTSFVKLDLVPVVVDTDYCLIQNPEALMAECQAGRYAEVDTSDAKQQARERHQAAIGLLNGELAHYLGVETASVQFRPFGSARLERVAISMQ